jgi:hypothetical protein
MLPSGGIPGWPIKRFWGLDASDSGKYRDFNNLAHMSYDMAKKPNTQKLEIAKDWHDYFFMYGTVVLTGIIAYSALFAIPEQINKISSDGWERIYYEEGAWWLDKTMETSDPDEFIHSCMNLSMGAEMALENTFIRCDNGAIISIIIKKNYDGECFSRYEGEC